jgi:hypothetical protein
MTMQYNYGRRRGSGAFFGVLLALILGASALGVFVHSARSGVAGKLAALITGRPPAVGSAQDVVRQLRQLHRLQTAEDSLDTVLDARPGNNPPPSRTGTSALAGTSLAGSATPRPSPSIAHSVMLVHGLAVAGVDMDKLQPDQVLISVDSSTRSIRLELPRSEIFRTVVDTARTRVYAPSNFSFVQTSPSLDPQTLQRSQAQLQQAAISDGILDLATRNAQTVLIAILRQWGFQRVEFR